MNNITITCTSDGFMLLLPSESGFTAKPLKAPESWGVSIEHGNWLKGFPIKLELKETSGVWEVSLGKHGVEQEMIVFSGIKASAEHVKAALQALWMNENGVVAPSVQTAPAVATQSAEPGDANVIKATASQKKWMMPVGLGLGAIILGVSAFFAANLFLTGSSQAPSLDLSNLSLEQVAEIDSNPMLMHTIKSNMLDAVKYGADAAKDMGDELSKEHIETLKSLGLDPGISIENATACFANLHK